VSLARYGQGPLWGDRGAALVEFALVTPIFFVLVLGIFEFGLIYRDKITISDAVNDAARSGAIAGNDLGALDDDPPPGAGGPVPKIRDATADFVTMKRLRQGLAALPVTSIERIVFFHAQDPTFGNAEQQMAEACTTGTGTSGSGAPRYLGACNVYADVEAAFHAYETKNIAYFSCELSAASPECNWPGRARNTTAVNPIAHPDHPGPDYLGVWIKLERSSLTGIVGSVSEMSDSAIVRLEPGLIER
jgi:hypothetical protein